MVTYIRSIDVGVYRHNYEGFYEKTSYQMSINRGRMTTNQGAYASLVGMVSDNMHIKHDIYDY